MKGFKPTGYGPTAGFKFPASMGFTGSTGAYTNVQPYVRRTPRAFKDGGYVSETVGDQGHALVQRSRPYTNEDQQSGGKSPLRRGFKKGGKVPGPPSMKHNMNPMKAKGPPSDAMKRSPRTMKKADGGLASLALMKRPKRSPVNQKMAPASTVKEKFAADGGRVYGSSSKGFGSDVRKTGEFIGQIPRMVVDAMKGGMRRTQEDIADSKRRRIDSIVDNNGPSSDYARGGKVRRSGKMKRGMMTKC